MLRGTQVLSLIDTIVSHTGLSPSVAALSSAFRYNYINRCRTVLQPQAWLERTTLVWALARSLAATCAIICYFLFLRVLRCFSSPRSPHVAITWCRDLSRRVSPFGHPRIIGHLPLPADFRSLSRPSSPLGSHRHPPHALVRFPFSPSPHSFKRG